VAYLVNNAISKGCHWQGESPSQSAVDTNSGVEHFSSRKVDSSWSCAHAAAEIQPSFLGGRVSSNSTNWWSSFNQQPLR